MKRFQRIFRGAFAFAALIGPAVAAAANKPLPCSVDALNVTCVMIGLDNPRGLAFGPRGTLFVAEAGRGGAVTAPCKAGTGFNCYGHTGAISRLWHGERVQVATGLPSLSFVQGASARGAHDIVMWSGKGPQPSVLGDEGALVTIGLEMTATARDSLGRSDLGRLVHIPQSTLLAPSSNLCPSCWSSVMDIAPFEPVPNPDPNKESDPYGLLVERHGQRHGEHEHHNGNSLIYTDASRNWVARVDAQGHISRLAVFPSRFQGRSTDSVPTSVVKGPDGDYYVGELVGIPFTGPTRPPANVYRVAAEPPHDVTVFLTGFNAIIDMAFKDGNLYVLQHWTISPTATRRDGQLVRVPCYGRPLVCDGERTVVIGGLDGPTSMAFGRDGALYVSHRGASPAFVSGVYTPVGEVLRIDLDLRDDDDHDEDERSDD